MSDENNNIKHIAIIMDGNGRWAKKKSLPRIEGHRAGAKTVDKILKACEKFDIKYLTLYAFSTENWKRTQDEVFGLMSLLKEFLDTNLKTLIEKKVQLRVIGRIKDLPLSTRVSVNLAIRKTSSYTDRVLTLALSYGGRAEIVDAINKIIKEEREGKLGKKEQITEESFRKYLYFPELPDPELMIRTSGELRISNFLLWQLSYSELWVTDTLWPDFNEEEFKKAIDDYYSRNRRYGGR